MTSQALHFINEAINALATEAYQNDKRLPTIEASIAWDLDRVDRAIGPAGASMFARLAESVEQAFVALHAAKAELEKK